MGPQNYDDYSPLSVVGGILLGLAVLMLGMYLLNNWYPSNVSSEPLVVWRSVGQQFHGFAPEASSQQRGYRSEVDLGELSRNPAIEAARRDVTVIRPR